MIPPRIELGTFCVLGRRDNRYTTESVSHTVPHNGNLFTRCFLKEKKSGSARDRTGDLLRVKQT
jgi:hypothetical protein